MSSKELKESKEHKGLKDAKAWAVYSDIIKPRLIKQRFAFKGFYDLVDQYLFFDCTLCRRKRRFIDLCAPTFGIKQCSFCFICTCGCKGVFDKVTELRICECKYVIGPYCKAQCVICKATGCRACVVESCPTHSMIKTAGILCRKCRERNGCDGFCRCMFCKKMVCISCSCEKGCGIRYVCSGCKRKKCHKCGKSKDTDSCLCTSCSTSPIKRKESDMEL